MKIEEVLPELRAGGKIKCGNTEISSFKDLAGVINGEEEWIYDHIDSDNWEIVVEPATIKEFQEYFYNCAALLLKKSDSGQTRAKLAANILRLVAQILETKVVPENIIKLMPRGVVAIAP